MSHASATHTCAAVTIGYPEVGAGAQALSPSGKDSQMSPGDDRLHLEGSDLDDERETVRYSSSNARARQALRSASDAASGMAYEIDQSLRSHSPADKSVRSATKRGGSDSGTVVSWQTVAESPKRSRRQVEVHARSVAGSDQPRIIPTETEADKRERDRLLQQAVGDSQKLFYDSQALLAARKARLEAAERHDAEYQTPEVITDCSSVESRRTFSATNASSNAPG